MCPCGIVIVLVWVQLMLVFLFVVVFFLFFFCVFFVFQAEDGIRDLVRSRGLGDVYKRQIQALSRPMCDRSFAKGRGRFAGWRSAAIRRTFTAPIRPCLLYTSDAADERSSVDLGGSRIIKKKNTRATLEILCRHKSRQ